MASIYVPPEGRMQGGNTKAEMLSMVQAAMQAKHARVELMMVMGDINADVAGRSPESQQ